MTTRADYLATRDANRCPATCRPIDTRGDLMAEVRCTDDQHDVQVKHRARISAEPRDLEVTW